MKSFRTSLDHLPPKAAPRTLTRCEIDGRKIEIAHPGDDVLVMVLAASGGTPGEDLDAAQATRTMFQFMATCLTPADMAWIKGRLWDREDPFSTQTFVELFEWIIGELTGEDPTQRSVSPSPQLTTGDASTPE